MIQLKSNINILRTAKLGREGFIFNFNIVKHSFIKEAEGEIIIFFDSSWKDKKSFIVLIDEAGANIKTGLAVKKIIQEYNKDSFKIYEGKIYLYASVENGEIKPLSYNAEQVEALIKNILI